jgi:betaine-aldehyde dehydrogenase
MKPQEMFRRYQMLIDGKWVEAQSGQRFHRDSPAHGNPVGDYPLAGIADVDAAVDSARRAFDIGPWRYMPGAERARLLLRVADGIRAQKDELALIETLESGKPISQARDEMEWAAGIWEYASTLARHTYGDTYNSLGEASLGLILREPIGVVGMITPWNFPLLIISQKLPFALAVGCTTVVKPSEFTSGTTLRLAKILEDAGIPNGVVNIVTGEGIPVGSHMAEHAAIDMMSFTGSTEVGRSIMTAASRTLKKVALELGGKNPQIIFADADLDAALSAVIFGVYFNAGQCCNSGSRILVEESIADEFIARLVELAKAVPVGDPLDEGTKVGAIVSQEQVDKIAGYIASGREQGARLCLGGECLKTKFGRFFQPTIFSGVTPTMEIAREEIFGPVLCVLSFNGLDEAVRIANDTMYGLSASVWTADIDKAFAVARSVRAGTIWINSFMDGHPELSFGGYKQSGLGRELGRHAIDDYTELKTIQIRLGEKGSMWLP